MHKFILVSFSTEKKYLNFLLNETQKCFGSTVIQHGFTDQKKLFEHLKDPLLKNKIQLIILDVAESDASTVQFLSNVNQSAPNAIKLLTSKSNCLLDIQKQIKQLHSIHFLNRASSSEDFLLALNHAKNEYANLQIVNKHQSNITVHSKSMDEKISKQLKALMDSNVTKEKLFSIIAHDLKSPFTELLGISEILLNDWNILSEAEKIDFVKALKLSSENTFKLLENLLNWLKSQKTIITTEHNTFNVSQLLESIIGLFKHNSTKRNITIKSEIGKDIELMADKNMIETIFRNLISNAMKFIPDGSSILISSKLENDFYTFCVADNGDGIQEQHIIDFFSFNPNLAKSNLEKFSGMGLLMCKEFAERNNGRFWLESKKGEGSKFYLTIPF